MNKINKHLFIATIALSVMSASAKERYGNVFRTSSAERVLAGCTPAQSSAELAVNNVRTIIYSGSDMWWDLFGGGSAYYLVPKVEDRSKGASSNFAGNVWFGGIDVGNQLKLAAQTYRQNGVDFWTGPLSTVDASISADVCQQYDKIYKLTRKEVDERVAGGPVTANIKNWPGNGDLSLDQDPTLAPYVDVNGDFSYDPEAGDYPYYDVKNEGLKDALGVCQARVFGDETLWWVYNDNGNVHVATGGKAIGMEVRAQAFAFKTTNEINNMTFYNYQIINRSNFALLNTYMTVWTDADLGYYGDDYIGCDVKRGLGYIYNADAFDETAGGANGYGNFIPALGCDFFQGPINTANGIDDDGDNGLPGGGIDEPGEQMGMTKFLFFNNSFPGVPITQTDPNNANQYYNYMTGFWKDGTPFTCDAATSYGGTIPTSFVYPGNTYAANPCGQSSPFANESAVGNDRRFMQSSGPFTLQPGAVNFITVGLPWARTTTTDPKASISLLKVADDKAQALFDNCFRVLGGPEAPDMTIQEMENELIIYFSNKPASNNYLYQYKEIDVSILVDTVGTPASGTVAATPAHFDNVDRYYRFEGFKVYQLKNNTVIQEELNDASKAKLIFNCDLANNVTRLINYEFDATTGGDIPVIKVDVNDNSNKGIKSSFRFTQDQFSTAPDKKVINHKEYYFYCVAYSYNEYGVYKEDQTWTQIGQPSYEGQKLTYLEGRKSKKAFGIPHNPAPEKSGSIANSGYGYGPKVTRLEGQGNGGNNLELTGESVAKILASSSGKEDVLTYENGRGPLVIKVVDPLNVPNSNFSVAFINKNWYYNATLTQAQMNDTMNADPCRSSAYHKLRPYPALSRPNVNHTSGGSINQDTTTWVLKDLGSLKEYYPCKAMRIGEEFYFSELGLSIGIGGNDDVAGVKQPYSIATDKIIKSGDIISATSSFASAGLAWLSGVSDRDGAPGFDWIRSGGYIDADNADLSDYQTNNAATGASNLIFADEQQYFEGLLGGTWAPYALTAATKTSNPGAPGWPNLAPSGTMIQTADLRALASVDIVFTKDKSKWTRAMVLEESDEPSAIPSGARKLETRRRTSVDKQGIALGAPGCNTAEASFDSVPGSPFLTGMSWFPGYAINLETGERLNIAFGEDSYQVNNNGDDMMWNPNDVESEQTYRQAFGGRHYVYVFGNNRSGTKYVKPTTGAAATASVPLVVLGKTIGSGNYTASNLADLVTCYKYANQTFAVGSGNLKSSAEVILGNIWTDAMWVNIPLTIDSKYNFKNPADMPCDAKVSLRVKKAYRPQIAGHVNIKASNLTTAGYITGGTALNINKTPIIQPYFPLTNAVNLSMQLSYDTLQAPINNNYNLYTFSTADIFTEINNADKHKSALDLINVVPNPYYAYSSYERSRIDNVVRITNLPNKCRIKIFTLNGTLIRTYNRDLTGQEDINIEESDFVRSKRLAFQDWDMKNQSGIPVASGLYIIHIDVPNVGEKILKWFGVMRPLDLQSY